MEKEIYMRPQVETVVVKTEEGFAASQVERVEDSDLEI